MKIKSAYWIFVLIFSISYLTACGGGSSTSEGTSGAPKISVSQTNIDFSGTVLNSYIDKKITITNTGNENLNIGPISSPSLPFSISSDTCSNSTLRPSQSGSLMVRFTPTNQGSSTDKFSIPSNDPASPAVDISLKGDGYGLNVWINQVNTSNCSKKIISLDVTVTGPSGAITGLNNNDPNNPNFRLYQNGSFFPSDVNGNYDTQPVSVVLALDSSGSLTTDLPAIKTAAKSFIDLLGIEDKAAVCKFRSEIDFFPETFPLFITTTSDTEKDYLKDYIDSAFNATDGTALYDAVYNSIDRAAEEGSNSKLAVIVLSDGVNTYSGVNTLQGVIDYAKQKKIPVFSIFYVDLNVYPNATPDVMQQLANDTGGQYYNSGDSNELQDIFEQIAYVLNNKYTVEYYGGICSGSIEVEVRVEDPNTKYYGVNSTTINF